MSVMWNYLGLRLKQISDVKVESHHSTECQKIQHEESVMKAPGKLTGIYATYLNQ